MIKKIKIKPSKKLLKHWVETLIPPYDVFFFKELTIFDEINKDLITIKEYIKTFDDIRYINAYDHWDVKNNAKYVYIDYKNNLLSNLDVRDYIYKQQIKCCRGLILDGDKVLTNWLFNSLKYKDKEILTIKYAKEIDDWIGYDNGQMSKYIKNVANKFIKDDGCNCLAVSLYGATKDDNWLKDWTDENNFKSQLKKINYVKVNDDYNEDDIIVFKKDNQTIHACYCVDKELFLNKSGQSKFNPIVLLPFNDVKKDWNNCTIEIYRKT